MARATISLVARVCVLGDIMSRLSVRITEQEAAHLDAIGGSRSDAVRGLIKASTSDPYKEFGSSSTRRFGGAARDEPLRELRGRAGRIKYSEMRKNNAVINAIFFAIETYLRSVSFYAESASDSPEDMEAAEHLDQCMGDMSFSWDDELAFILVMLEQGFSALEIVYKLRRGRDPGRYGGIKDPAISQFDDGKVGWRKWAPRPWRTLTAGKEFYFDDNGGIRGINQTSPITGNPIPPIPIETLLLFRTTPAPNNSPKGQSILRGAYEAYYYSRNIAEIEGIGIDRDLAGLPIVYLGTDCSLSGTDSDYQKARTLVENIRNDEQAGIVVPRPKLGTAGEGIGMLVELLGTTGNKQFDTSTIITRWDKRIAMTMMAQFIMVGMDNIGAYSLGSFQGDVFAQAISAIAGIIAQTITRHAVPRLFALNPSFRIEELPRWTHSEVGIPNLDAMAKFVNALVGVQALTPDDELERHLRQMASLPEPPEREIQITTPTIEPELSEDIEMSKGWLQRRYSRWLSEIAPRIADADERTPILKHSIDALAMLLKQDPPTYDYRMLAEGGEHNTQDGILKAVARKLAHLEKDAGTTDVLRAGASLFHLFKDSSIVEKQTIEHLTQKQEIAALVQAAER